MIVCFRCSHEIKRSLDMLMKSGDYADYAEVIEAALSNLAMLQTELGDRGAVIIDPAGLKASATRSRPSRTLTTRESSVSPLSGLDDRSQTSQVGVVPALFRAEDLSATNLEVAPDPEDQWTHDQEVPVDHWLFGQYNRLLPAKATCRALAHLLKANPGGVPLDYAADTISLEAAVLGDYLRGLDQRNRIGRDHAVSTAFPSSGRDKEKSCSRYATMFVGSANTAGRVYGLPIELKLINQTDTEEVRIQLTEIGWRLASLTNPVLDEAQHPGEEKFSVEERELLLSHIAKSVRREDFAYRALLAALQEGSGTPDSLDSLIRERFVGSERADIRDSFVATQRSGALSRMADLHLIRRGRHGVRVMYTVTEQGKDYLQGGRR